MDRDYQAAKLFRNLCCRGKNSDDEDVEFKRHVKNITYAYENGLIDFNRFKELVRMLYTQKKQEDKKDEGIKGKP